MNKRRIGTITLSITLISFGILLLMRNFIDINLREVFSIAWPCIIILFGLEIVVTKIVVSKKYEDTRTSIDTISVILLSLTIIISLIYSSFSFDNGLRYFSLMKYFDARNFSIKSPHFIDKSTYSYTFNFNAENKEQLEVVNSFGNVKIKEGQGENIEIIGEIEISHNDEEYASELSKNIIQIEDIGPNLKVITNLDSQYDKGKAGNINVSYDIYIPNHIKANVENKFGDTSINNIKNDVEILNQHGNIELSDISGNIKLKNSFGRIYAYNIDGKVELKCENGNVEIENIGSLSAVNSFGSVKAIDISGEVNIENQYNSVYVDKANSNVKIKNKFGNIDAKNINGNLNIENENGNIEVENVKGDVIGFNKFGDSYIENANKFIKIISKNGDVSFKADTLIEEGLEIENEFGDIGIWLPSNQKGRFNLVAEFGEIKNKLGLNVNEGITEQNVNDFIGNDGAKFYIRSRNGDINVNAN